MRARRLQCTSLFTIAMSSCLAGWQVVDGFICSKNKPMMLWTRSRTVRPSQRRNSRSGSLKVTQRAPPDAEILSESPLVFVVRDLLSKEEAEAYMEKVQELEAQNNRTMTRSNPPEVSISVEKLWPLPFLSLLAGIPPLLRMDDVDVTLDSLLQNVLPPIVVALVLTVSLALFGAVPLIRLLSDSSSSPSLSRRTSEAMALNQEEDVAFITDLVDRVSSITDHSWDKWEAPVVTRYAPGAIFATHGDASPTKGSEWNDTGGQRVVTCICYLNSLKNNNNNNNNNDGGETSFDKLGFAVTPKRGSALFFFPANPDTLVADDRTTHESLPPTQEKWIVQMFGRIGPRVPSPLGIPDTYCTAAK